VYPQYKRITRGNVVNKLFPLTLAALGLATPASAQITAFQHIILVIQENRTPDNLFQGLCPTTNPSACNIHLPGPGQYNIQTTQWLDKTSSTGFTNPHKNPLGLGYDVGHVHSAWLKMCDLDVASNTCKMDGAALVPCDPKAVPCPKAKAVYGFVDPSEVQPYLDIVHNYGWANYMFQTNEGPSYPAHQFLFGATSAPSAADDHSGNFVSEGPGPGKATGCIAPPANLVPVINPQGVEFTKIFPCYERQTVGDLLNTGHVTWRYYGSDVTGAFHDSKVGGVWIAPNSINHICKAVNGKCTGKEWTSHLEFAPSKVLSDISSPTCNLRGVSWVIPDSFDSDHSWDVRNTGGPSWVAQIVNAVGQSTCKNPSDGSSYWDSTAIIILWDDWGGWYDHERPFIEAAPQGGYQMGFRVPLIFVSAYTPMGYISNLAEDDGSVIRFVEHNFGLMEGQLTFADARGTGDLTEFYNLGNAPRTFTPINAPLSAQYFLTRKPSGLPVDED
jgi:phospholipase C